MPIDWKSSEGNAPSKLDEGTYLVRVKRIIVRTRDGEPMTDKTGCPRIGVVFDCPEKAATHTSYVSCGGQYGWTLTGILRATTTADEQAEMDERGVELGHFAEESGQIAAQYLLGRWVVLSLTRNGNYMNARYASPGPNAASEPPTPPPAPAPRPMPPRASQPPTPPPAAPNRLPPPNLPGPKPPTQYTDDVPF